MTRYAIIEDNPFALEHLKQTVSRLRHNYELVFTASSVRETVEYLAGSPEVDLLFMDIELTDGKCFSIFEQVRTVVPIIFTTAYDDFAIQAFKVNGMDYLLKPISEAELAHAIDKFEHLHMRETVAPQPPQPEEEKEAVSPASRILTVSGDKYSYIDLRDVAYFVSESNYIFAYLNRGGRRMINLTNLSQLEQLLPANEFYRLTRNVVASIGSIASVSKYFRGRLLVKLQTDDGAEQEITVSSSNRDSFLSWLGH